MLKNVSAYDILPGDLPMPTIYDIAQRAGVSIATVSRVLNHSPGVKEETRQRVIAAIRELNYSHNAVAAALTRKKTYTLGLLLPDIANPFFAELARGVEDRANYYGFNVIICNTDNKPHKEQAYVRLLLKKRIDGLLFAAAKTGSQALKQVQNSGLPVVLVAREATDVDLCSVLVDNVEAGYTATRHLIELGHTSIALATQSLTIKTSQDRRLGYLRALEEYGLPISDELQVFDCSGIEGGRMAARQLLQLSKSPTAVVAFNDMVAIGIIAEAKSAGWRIPEQLSVVGFDDTIIASVTDPPLTTVAQPIYSMGHRAIDCLVNMINGENLSEKRVILDTHLVIRKSSAPLISTINRRKANPVK